MERAGESDHAGATGVCPGNLHSVFSRFGAGCEKDRLGVLDGRQRVQPLGQFDINLICRDLEGGVGESLHLRGGGSHHFRMAVPCIGDGDARCEIDIAAAFNIPEFAVLGTVGKDRRGRCHSTGNSSFAPLQQIGIARHGKILS